MKVVSGVDEAIEHINTYGTMHSEVSSQIPIKRKFRIRSMRQPYMSTRQDLQMENVWIRRRNRHIDAEDARKRLGLENLVSEKYIIFGDGQNR